MRKAVYKNLKLDEPVKVYVSKHTLQSIGIDDDITECEGVITGFYGSGWVQIKVRESLYDIPPKYLFTK